MKILIPLAFTIVKCRLCNNQVNLVKEYSLNENVSSLF